MAIRWYKLVNEPDVDGSPKRPVPISVTELTDKVFEPVAKTYVGKTLVSTVFFSLDHRHFGSGPPIVFGTLVFGGRQYDHLGGRCSTWNQALAQHEAAVAGVKAANTVRNKP